MRILIVSLLALVFVLPIVVTAQYVSLQDNDGKKDIELISKDSFALCPDGEIVSLRGLSIQDLPNDLVRSKSIASIDISDNRLKDIRLGAFDTASDLVCLNLSRNSISMDRALLFGHRSLIGLDLSHQTQQHTVSEFDEFDELEGTTDVLHCDPNSNFPGLTYLDVSGNIFGYLDHNFSVCFPTLSRLYLNDLPLLYLSASFFARLPKSLVSLHIENNHLTTLNFSEIGAIEALHANSNPLMNAGHTLKSNNLKVLTLSNCSLTAFDSELLVTLPNLVVLDLSFNKLSNDDDFIDHRSLEILSLSHNNFRDIPSLGKLFNLKRLSLSYNRISDISHAIENPALEILSLKGNQIRKISPNVFASTTKLETLDLSDNMLEVLEQSWMEGLDNLHVLDIRHNRFKSIPNMFGAVTGRFMQNLTDLYIKSESFDRQHISMFRYVGPDCLVHVG